MSDPKYLNARQVLQECNNCKHLKYTTCYSDNKCPAPGRACFACGESKFKEEKDLPLSHLPCSFFEAK